MSPAQSGAHSSVSSLERDARRLHDHHGVLKPAEIAVGVIVGRTSEFFDFFALRDCIGHRFFRKLVFPFVDS